VEILIRKITETVGQALGRYEIIAVDDGSTDYSFERLCLIFKDQAHLRNIKFRRNFGKTLAMQAGIDHSLGEMIVTRDADLQNDPSGIPKPLAKLGEGYDVVSGWRRKHKDNCPNLESFIGL
jgi:glycosyltransferase involved in cell wall biosynthesis